MLETQISISFVRTIPATLLISNDSKYVELGGIRIGYGLSLTSSYTIIDYSLYNYMNPTYGAFKILINSL